MTFQTDDDAVKAIKRHLTVNQDFLDRREQSKELKALVNGEGFIDELIDNIEVIESELKAKARKKYSRDIKDLFSRLFQPIDNIYYATGGVKDYDISSSTIKTEYITKIANIRDGKPLSAWVQHKAIQLFNTDPNGLIFLEYSTKDNQDIYPTYKSIHSIRYYRSRGQLCDYVIFEPKKIKNKFYWRIVDDKYDRTFLQDGEQYILQENLTFEHPFGEVPALICSNVSYVGEKKKLPSIDSILGLVKELAQNQSILTLYKIYRGMPLFWKVVQFCGDCQGTGKTGEEVCGTCNGHGRYKGKTDVTDVIEVPIPEGDDKLLTGDNIGGYLAPQLDTWKQFNEELQILEEKAYKSHWGTSYGLKINSNIEKTATEVIFDKQPFENQLNKYADFAEYIEWKLSEWILNFYDLSKDRKESAITINLGRRYIVEGYDTLLERYELAVKSETNTVILDKLFEEYLWSKFRNNPIDLQVSLAKAKVEPYLHLTLKNVLEVFGNEEAQRKVLFQKFWLTVNDFSDLDKIRTDFNTWFEKNKITKEQIIN